MEESGGNAGRHDGDWAPAVATMNIRVFSLAHFVEGTRSPPRRALGRDQGCLAVNDGSESSGEFAVAVQDIADRLASHSAFVPGRAIIATLCSKAAAMIVRSLRCFSWSAGTKSRALRLLLCNH